MIEMSPEYADAFLRAGGTLTLFEFMALTREDQVALRDAGDAIRAETAATVIEALSDALQSALDVSALKALEDKA